MSELVDIFLEIFTFTLVFQFRNHISCVKCLHFLDETKEGTVVDDLNGQPRRSKRIQEIEAKKEIELQQLQNEKKSVEKKVSLHHPTRKMRIAAVAAAIFLIEQKCISFLFRKIVL